MTLKELMQKHRDAAQAVIDSAKADGRDEKSLTADEHDQMEKSLAMAEEFAKELKAEDEKSARVEADRERFKALADGPDPTGTDDDPSKGADPVEAPVSAKSVGEQWVSSKSYETVRKSGMNSTTAQKIDAATIDLKTLVTTHTSTPSDGSMGVVTRVLPTVLDPTPLLTAISIGNTGRDAIVSHRMVPVTNAADVVAEGALKPESAVSFTSETLVPEKIAHWLPVTEEALEDAPYMRGLIDDFLTWGVRQKVASQVMAAIDAATGLGVQAFDTDVFTTIKRAATLAAEANEYMPTGILMNPADADNVQLTKGTDGHFVGGGPFNPGPLSIWGLPVIRVPRIAAGTAYVGALRTITWLQRTPIRVRVGWQNAQFVENKLTILAEQRGMTDVMSPASIVKAALA